MANSRQKAFKLIVLSLLVATALVWFVVLQGGSQGNLLKVYYLNIGQGDATLIEAPNGNQVLIDGGPGDGSILKALGEVMPVYDHSIDVVIATHPDADHIGGLPDVLDRYSVSQFIESGNIGKTATYKKLEETVSSKVPRHDVAKRGDRLVLDKNRQIYLGILYPDKDVSNIESNTASVVTRLTYGNKHFIFSGDAPRLVEQHLVQIDSEGLKSDVLKAGHHGSRTSSDPIYVKVVSPTYAVISAGLKNKYGHPHKETLQTLDSLGIKVLRTDELGNIEIDSDGFNVFVVK